LDTRKNDEQLKLSYLLSQHTGMASGGDMKAFMPI
jgi:hypothetical protein